MMRLFRRRRPRQTPRPTQYGRAVPPGFVACDGIVRKNVFGGPQMFGDAAPDRCEPLPNPLDELDAPARAAVETVIARNRPITKWEVLR